MFIYSLSNVTFPRRSQSFASTGNHDPFLLSDLLLHVAAWARQTGESHGDAQSSDKKGEEKCKYTRTKESTLMKTTVKGTATNGKGITSLVAYSNLNGKNTYRKY